MGEFSSQHSGRGTTSVYSSRNHVSRTKTYDANRAIKIIFGLALIECHLSLTAAWTLQSAVATSSAWTGTGTSAAAVVSLWPATGAASCSCSTLVSAIFSFIFTYSPRSVGKTLRENSLGKAQNQAKKIRTDLFPRGTEPNHRVIAVGIPSVMYLDLIYMLGLMRCKSIGYMQNRKQQGRVGPADRIIFAQWPGHRCDIGLKVPLFFRIENPHGHFFPNKNFSRLIVSVPWFSCSMGA